jgi:hypothetical protein
MTKTKDKRDTIKRHDFSGLRDRLTKIDHTDILTKGRYWLRVAERTDAEAVLTLSTAVSVTGICRDDFEALIELGAIEIHSYEFNQPRIQIKDLCAVVEDSARCKAGK